MRARRNGHHAAGALVVALCFLSFAATARAQEPEPVVDPVAIDDPATSAEAVPRRTPVGDLAVVGLVAGPLALAAGLILYVSPDPWPGATPGTWRGGILLDDATRRGLRAGSAGDRAAVATISDVLMVVTMANAVGMDALGIPLAQGDFDLAWQATASYSLAIGLSLTIFDLFKDGVGRARPYEVDCAANPKGYGCGTTDAYGSFYSGHAAVAFTSAGFTCAMHLTRSLYDDVGADAVSCGSSLAVAAATGLLRIAADRHYLSDVVVGALFGFAVGYVVPLIFVPSRPARGGVRETEGSGVSVMVAPTFSPGSDGGMRSGSYGLGASGVF